MYLLHGNHMSAKKNIQLNIAIVGLGTIAKQAHLPTLIATATNIKQIIDPNPDIATIVRSLPGQIDYSQSIEEILPSINVALVTSPSALHYTQVGALLTKGLHVFCEKPLSLTTTQAKKLANLARQKSLTLQVGYYRRFHESSHLVQQLLKSGELGALISCKIVAGSCETSSTLPPSMFIKDLCGGGVLMDFGVHVVDRLYSWFDQLILQEYFDDEKGGLEANCLINILGINGKCKSKVSISLSRTCELGYYSLLKFEKGWIKIMHNEGNIIYFSLSTNKLLAKAAPLFPYIISQNKSHLNYFRLQWDEFVNRINGGIEILSSLDDSIRTTSFIELCYKQKQILNLPWETLI